MTLLTLNPLARRSPLFRPAAVECADTTNVVPPTFHTTNVVQASDVLTVESLLQAKEVLKAGEPRVYYSLIVPKPLQRPKRGRPIRDYRLMAKSPPCDQAARILAAFGGPKALKTAMYQCGAYRNLTSIYRWLLPHADGGSDGRVPRQSHRDVWRAAIAADLHKSLGITHKDWELDISPFHPKRIRNHGFKNNAGRQPGRRSPVVPTQIKASTQIKATT